LLPAGESTYLGTIKSMVIDPYPPDELLADRLARRPTPLSNEYIILISRNLKLKDNIQVRATILTSFIDSSAIIILF